MRTMGEEFFLTDLVRICKMAKAFDKDKVKLVLSIQALRVYVDEAGAFTDVRRALLSALEQMDMERKYGVMPKTGLESLVQRAVEGVEE